MNSIKVCFLSILLFFNLTEYTKATVDSSLNSLLVDSKARNNVNLNYNRVFDDFFLIKEEQELYCSNEITLELRDLGQVTGLALDPKTKKIVKAKGVKVILQIDKSNRRGWSIKKAYPIK